MTDHRIFSATNRWLFAAVVVSIATTGLGIAVAERVNIKLGVIGVFLASSISFTANLMYLKYIRGYKTNELPQNYARNLLDVLGFIMAIYEFLIGGFLL